MDPKQRFSSRVEDYIQYRPGYPAGVLDTLRGECGLSTASVVADIGSGTGLLSRIFLDAGCRVFGVEPNAEMRTAGERLMAGFPLFSSLPGSAEDSGLADSSVDLITAGQAFHWFDPTRAHAEFRRILKPDGWVALVWNSRCEESSPFLRAYNDMLKTFSSDYTQVNHRNVEANPETIPNFFGGPYRFARFDNVQVFDFSAARGRLMSSSYAPEPGSPQHAPMLEELRRIFDLYQRDGRVAFEYDTELYYGKLAG